MSDEMAKTDSAAEESSLNGEAASLSSVAECPEAPGEVSSVPASPKNEETPDSLQDEKMDIDPSIEVKFERQDSDGEVQDTPDNIENKIDTPNEPKAELDTEKPVEDDKRGLKRRASEAFNNEDQEFKGFDIKEDTSITLDYVKVLDRLEAEVAAAIVGFTPLKSVMATPPVPVRASKRSRQDTDSSRPSSALSSRSESDGLSTEAAASPGAGRRRTTTTEMSSPLLRVPIDKGWKRELVYRAALDAHSRRNADIYYYTPTGKKLRSTREVSEHLAGTGLTLENFSFFKEPLGLDDPEKEIIRDAKVMRKGESPVVARTANKVASPEHTTAAKLKVKSMGSRLSTSTPKQAPKPQKKPAATTDNNNSAAWKKPMNQQQPASLETTPNYHETLHQVKLEVDDPEVNAPKVNDPKEVNAPKSVVAAKEVEKNAVDEDRSDDEEDEESVMDVEKARAVTPPTRNVADTPVTPGTPQESSRRVQQPCSMSCGGGRVPSLCCVSCLCLYHPHCVQYVPDAAPFLCKNCRSEDATTHKAPRAANAAANAPPAHSRVTLKMKVASCGGADGERVWSVSRPTTTTATVTTAPPPPIPPQVLAQPQSIAVVNGRRFIVVPTTLNMHEEKRRTRVTNGSSTISPVTSPLEVTSPRRRGRSKVDDTDYVTAFFDKASELKYDVVVQIFQYVGMRELAACARVSRPWRALAATRALWRHVRMKNAHVSDWGGLCALLKKRGTKRLDLRKMLLPQNDAAFWEQFSEHIPSVDSLERIELCRCPASVVESVCRSLPGLRSISALAIKDALLDPSPLASLTHLQELRLKSMAGLSLTRDLKPIAGLQQLQHLSLTSIKELGWCACDVLGSLTNLEVLELGECTFGAEFGNVLAKLTRLKRLRLERGTSGCAAPALLRALSQLPALTRLELVNFDVKVGFDDALAECKNIQRLLIIPTYVSQSATTNKQVLSGVLRLKDTLTHLMWGVTIELLRVTELFIDQCSGGAGRRDVGECIPVLKPVPGCRLAPAPPARLQPPQVEILPLPMLQRLLSAQLPNTKLKLLRIPFHATWRQSLNDFQ